ncbi:MAG: DUF4159 domain-containing protein [Planctomycetaceae bacterium]|nr:DUF4159 domain-containing protein [Planctomycetaceae bacterium]
MFFIFFGLTSFGVERIDSVQIKLAINNGITYLKNKQAPNGQWQYEISGHTLGATAMCVLAFIDAGVLRDDDSLLRGVGVLRSYRAGENIFDVYPVAVQTIALIRFGESSDLPAIKNNIQWLIKRQVNDDSAGAGGWQYSSGHYSTFETYYVCLAFYEAEQIGVTIPRAVWDKIRQFWERTQNTDGSWGYRPLSRGSGNAYSCTTNAGIISLILSTSFHDSGKFRVTGNHIQCGQFDPHNISERITSALASLDSPQISQQVQINGILPKPQNSNNRQNNEIRWVHYNLFAAENVGRFLGRSEIGQCDWYREGTLSLLRQLRENQTDHWIDSSGETILQTSCAVSFLAKGRRQIAVSKVCNLNDADWNQHPYDIDHLLRFVGGRWNFPLGWRQVDLLTANVDELIRTPVIYFSGKRLMSNWNDVEKKSVAIKLRDYISRGGFIVAESLGDDNIFEVEFFDLMNLVFGDSGYEVGLLDSDHPAWSMEVLIEPDQRRPIKGITTACRTNVFFIPATKNQPSLSCLWEISRVDGRNDLYSPLVKRRIENGLNIGWNILSYAIDTERQYRDETNNTSTPDGEKNDFAIRRGGIFLGVLLQGEVNSASRALSNLLKWIKSNLGMRVVDGVDLVGFDSEMFGYPVLFMSGRKAFTLTQKQREMLRRYLEHGGFLFVNSVCSSKTFTDAFIEEAGKILPDCQIQIIPQDDVLLSDKLGGFNIKNVEISQKEHAPNRQTIINFRNEKPELYGVRIGNNNYWSIILSPMDVICPLESSKFATCRSLSANSALQITINYILYTLEPQK